MLSRLECQTDDEVAEQERDRDREEGTSADGVQVYDSARISCGRLMCSR